ncbi:MAG: flagellar basal body P-ring formation chaperone FlgA [Halieaceae bacterium]|nr:flagellar basal body P-ring formation chaperone FlgA [Halieaceae bacterium]
MTLPTGKTLRNRWSTGTPTRRAARGLSLLATAAFLAATPATLGAAAAHHPHEDILAVVEFAALDAAMAEGFDQVEVRVLPLDQRLRPAQCERPLEIVRSHSGRVLGPVSYGVRCSSPSPWTLYLRAEVSAALELPVLARPLPRGALIGESDLRIVERRISSRNNDLITDKALAVGMELRRPLSAGSELRFGQVVRPELVSRGQIVTLVAGANGLEVRMQGKAMGSGAEGDRLLVTNLRSGRRIEGIVRGDGSVSIP